MKNNLRLRAMGVTVLALCTLISSGCKQGGAGRSEVKECSTYNNDEAACDNAKTTKGVKCYYANQTCSEVPSPQQATGSCVDLSSHKDKCESRMDCKYTNNTCEDAKPAACDNVKVEDACKNVFQAFCAWDATAKKCQAKRNQGLTTDIYKWKQLALPANHQINHISSLVVSKDNQQLYIISRLNGEEGLYHSADGGTSWAFLAGAHNNGLETTPKQGAQPLFIDTRTDHATIELKPTVAGVVVFDKTNAQIASLDGATTKWGLNPVAHHENAGQPGDQIAQVLNFGISFVDVSPDGTEIYFGYVPNGLTEGIYAHVPANADGASALGISVASKHVADSNGGPLADKVWSRIGFAHNGDMLLYSAQAGHRGVFRVAQAQLAQANPQLITDHPVLFPEQNNLNGWDDQNLGVMALHAYRANINGNPTDVHMAVVNDGQNNYSYLAYFNGDQTTGAATVGGPAGAGGHATRTYQGWRGVGFTDYNGVLRLVSNSDGILGIGSPDCFKPQMSYSLAMVNAKNVMMDDGSPVVAIGINDNENIRAIYGDDDLTYYFIAGKGLFSRTLEQGQPRP